MFNRIRNLHPAIRIFLKIAGLFYLIRYLVGFINQRRFKLRERVVVITGGSRGLGLVMAREFAKRGAHLAILARNRSSLERAEHELSSAGAVVLALPCDMARPDQVQHAIDQIMARFGRIDVLVNNAGIIQVGPLEHMQTEDFTTAMDVHAWGPLHAINAVIPTMAQQRFGRIVNITSIGGRIAVPHLLPYVMSKFAQVGLSDGLRPELAKSRIRVTTVIPGLMRTGSPPQALFKGDHSKEYRWFSFMASLPLTSTSALAAARQIVAACQRGDPYVFISLQARLAVILQALLPTALAWMQNLACRLMPGPTSEGGDQAKPGSECEVMRPRAFVHRIQERAARANNEL
jgi:NAD(P)-dependent dehydrogenase (short-subunit alcohol dehydrogenase family)